jgi:hypothetical protein
MQHLSHFRRVLNPDQSQNYKRAMRMAHVDALTHQVGDERRSYNPGRCLMFRLGDLAQQEVSKDLDTLGIP